jgi:hypothetical protein
MPNPYYLHFDALLALFCSSSGLRQKLQLLNGQGIWTYIKYDRIFWTGFGIWSYRQCRTAGFLQVKIIYLHSCC